MATRNQMQPVSLNPGSPPRSSAFAVALRRVLQLLLCSVLLWLVACRSEDTTKQGAEGKGSGQAAKPIKLAFVTNNTSQFWTIAQAGIRAFEKEHKVQVDVVLPDGTVADQNKKLEELASQRYDAISVSPIAPADQVNKLNEVAKQSALITVDSDAPDSERLLYIGTNNFEAGRALGKGIVELLPEGGKMAVFVGTLSADNAKQRLAGIESALEGHGIEIVDKREDQTDRAKAQSNVEDLLNARADLDLVAGLWSYNGPAIALAIDRLGKKGKVHGVAFDEEAETLRAIERGTLALTVVQKPYQFGYQASEWMHALASDAAAAKARLPSPPVIDTGVEVIRQDNVAAFQEKLAKLTQSAN